MMRKFANDSAIRSIARPPLASQRRRWCFSNQTGLQMATAFSQSIPQTTRNPGCGKNCQFPSTLYRESHNLSKQTRPCDGKSTISMSIAINNEIVKLGKRGDWSEILRLYQEQKQHFNSVNYATVLSQLGRQRSMQMTSPLFQEFLEDLNSKVVNNGVRWMEGVKAAANVIHAIGKMGLQSNPVAMELVRNMVKGENAHWIFESRMPQCIANCVWACAKLRIESPALFGLLDYHAEWIFENGNTQEIANCIWSCASLGVRSPNLFAMLEQKTEWLFENGNVLDIANCVWACGTLEITSPNLFALLDQKAKWLFDYGAPLDIYNCIWACGKLGINSPNVFELLEENAARVFINSQPRAVANYVWACGIVGVQSPKLFELLEQNSEWMFQNGNTHDIANCVVACARLDVESPNLFRLLEKNAVWLIENSTAQGIANCIWACGTLGVVSTNLFVHLNRKAEWMFRNGNQQNIANCAWACGKLGIESPNLFRLLDQNAQWLFDSGNPQMIANCIWACGVLQIKSPNLLAFLVDKTEWMLENGNEDSVGMCISACQSLGTDSFSLSKLFRNPQNIPRCVFLHRKYGIRCPKLIEAVEENAEWMIENGSIQDITDCVSLCGTLGIICPKLFDLLERNAQWLVAHGNAMEIADCAWGLSVLGSHSPEFFNALNECSSDVWADASSDDLSKLCYSLAILDVRELKIEGLLAELWRILMERDIHNVSEEYLTRLFIIKSYSAAFGIELRNPSLELQRHLDEVKFATDSSTFEDEVSRGLIAIGFDHKREVSPFGFAPGLLSIDIACTDQMIAIECDGPSHYVSVVGDVDDQLENGRTKAKRRLLERLGWKVINLNWKEVAKNSCSQWWLKAVINAVGVSL